MTDIKIVPKVVRLPCETTQDLPTQRVLESALKAELDEVLVIGREADGKLYLASSVADAAEVLWLLEKAKKAIL